MAKYRFKSRGEAEDYLARVELQLTVNRIALDALLRDEFAWTEWFTAPGPGGAPSRFQMGVARAASASGGVVLVREQYGEQAPSQNAYWAETWIAEKAHDYVLCDAESRAYRDCFLAVRSIHHRLANAS